METWQNASVKNDLYINQHLVKEPPALENATKTIRETNYPQMEVSPAQGKFLYMLAKMRNAKRVLEIGTFYGYSTMWFAKAVPDGGLVVSIEMTEKFVDMAQRNVSSAGLASKVELLHGDAAALLGKLIADKVEPFDFIFIDAHKPSYPQYLSLCMQLAKPGTVICGDNVILDGELANMDNNNPKAASVRAFIEELGVMEGVESTALQTIGVKGYDGFTLSIVGDAPSFRA